MLCALLASGCAVPIDTVDAEDVADPPDETNEPIAGSGGLGEGAGGTVGSGGELLGSGGELLGSGGELLGNGGSEPSTGGATGSGGSDGAPPVANGCEWLNEVKQGFLVGGTCYIECSPGVSVDGSGWGYENGASCIAAGSPVSDMGTRCEIGGGADMKEGECPPDGSYVCPPGATCGCEIVPGLGARKAALWAAGASEEPYMLAAAMMETRTMSALDYPYGDNKSGYGFNAGVCKQNWWMTSMCHAPWNGLDGWDYDTSATMNTDLALDVQIFRECRALFGETWWSHHRQGEGYNPFDSWHVEDVANFKEAMDWTFCMLESHSSDDVRFWVNVGAI